jgi:ABC-type lipoprotein release transport system permease subunit
MVEQVRSTVWGISPTQPIERLEPRRAAYDSTTNRERFFLELLAVFSTLTTLLAAAGVYALLSRYLARRRREVAIRIALGAAPGQVAAHFAQSSLVPSAAGVLLGAAVTLPLSRVLEDLLFQTRPGEPLAVALTAATLLAVAALACVHPVRRALHTDVVEAVRGE